MDLTKLKKYPSQISTAFRRFPLASAFAIFAALAFIYFADCAIEEEITHVKFMFWLAIYPVAAMIVALTTSIVQESFGNRGKLPQVVTGVVWFGLSCAIASCLCGHENFEDNWSDGEIQFLIGSLLVAYVAVILSLFVAPFFKQKNENGFWIFLVKTLKSYAVSLLVSSILLAAVELLLLGFFGLFGFSDSPTKPFIYVSIFCAATVQPLLFFSGIPSVGECLEKPPVLSKFVTSVCRFLFIPVLSLSLLLFYGYTVKFFIWNMPEEVVIALVSVFMVFVLALSVTLYPARLESGAKFERVFLKVLPAASVPLVILMSVAVYNVGFLGFDEFGIYLAALNLYFYVALAILLVDKIKCKFRYMAVVFVALLAIVTISPLRASNIVERVLPSLEKPSEESEEDAEEAGCGEESDSEKRESHRETLHDIQFYKYDGVYDIPGGATKFTQLKERFDSDEFEVRNDSVFFQVTLKEPERTYDFAVPITDKPTIFESKDAAIGVKEMYLFVEDRDGEIYKSFSIKGFLFVK